MFHSSAETARPSALALCIMKLHVSNTPNHSVWNQIVILPRSGLWRNHSLQGCHTAFLIPNADHFLHFREKNLSVSNPARGCGLQNGGNRCVD
jgi:hypothetical protein